MRGRAPPLPSRLLLRNDPVNGSVPGSTTGKAGWSVIVVVLSEFFLKKNENENKELRVYYSIDSIRNYLPWVRERGVSVASSPCRGISSGDLFLSDQDTAR